MIINQIILTKKKKNLRDQEKHNEERNHDWWADSILGYGAIYGSVSD